MLEADPVVDVDQVLADSFPASDPPSWTPGVARLSPIRHADKSATSPGSPPVNRGASTARANSDARSSATIALDEPRGSR
jgi:hypothetical protein